MEKFNNLTKEELKALEDMELDIDLEIIDTLCDDIDLQEQVKEFMWLSKEDRDRVMSSDCLFD